MLSEVMICTIPACEICEKITTLRKKRLLPIWALINAYTAIMKLANEKFPLTI